MRWLPWLQISSPGFRRFSLSSPLHPLSALPILASLMASPTDAQAGAVAGDLLEAARAQTADAPSNPWIYESNIENAKSGYQVRGIGDVNGDGYSDLAATRFGAVSSSTGLRSESVLVFAGGPTGLPLTPTWTLLFDNLANQFNIAVAAAGDVNQDGYDDLLVGAPNYNVSAELTTAGAAFLLPGSASGPVTSGINPIVGVKKDDRLGTSVAGIGDVNGDGYPDIAIGAPFAESGESSEGLLYVYPGGPDGLQSSFLVRLEGDQSGAQLGCSVARAGDLNGDGVDDILTAACWADNPETNEGQVRVYFGSTGTISSAADWFADGDTSEVYAGYILAGGRDFNADGYPDIALSLLFFDDQQTDSGLVRVYGGTEGDLLDASFWSHSTQQANGLWGQGLTLVRDLSGDGIDDLLISSGRIDKSLNLGDSGMVSLFSGGSGTPSSTAAWSLYGDKAGAQFGASIDFLGDVNGDGCVEITIGAPGYGNTESNEGRVYAYTADSRDGDIDGFCPGDLELSDCDDTQASVYPGASEVIGNGIDEDCDGQELCYVDGDGDGYYPADATSQASSDLTCAQPGLLPATAGPLDCDDTASSIYPGAEETCNYADDDCDNLTDEDVTIFFYLDQDSDTYGDPFSIVDDCTVPQGYVENSEDCNDSDPTINPNMLELPTDGVDQNCDGGELCYLDGDNDGYRPDASSTTASADLDCGDPGEAGASTLIGDCDDTNAAINPGVLETCDGLDGDCDNVIDEGTSIDCPTGDFDEDGFTEQDGDCNDQLDGVNPGANEACDSLDNDCDGVVDEGDVCVTPTPDDGGGGCSCRSTDPSPVRPLSTLLLVLGLVALRTRRSSRSG